MAKDPAMLWYWNDWYSGTVLMSRFLKGCYMDLLHAQFNHGPLSLEEIKTILGSDFGSSWPTLQKKFSQTDDKFFNERLEAEKDKRKKHSINQSINAKKRWNKCDGNANAYAKTMPLENENENENRNEDETLDRGIVKGERMDLVLPEIKIGAVQQLFKISKGVDVDEGFVQSLWQIFKVQNLDGSKFYKDESAIFSHFINWTKTQNAHRKTDKDGVKLGTSEARIAALKNW